MFRQYHYLSGSLAEHARCYVAVYQDKPVGFIAVMHIHMRARYYRVTRLVVLPDYQGMGVGKRLLNFIAELYTFQTKIPFYILTSNPQIIRGKMESWKITRLGHASKGQNDTRINSEIRASLSRKRITVSLQYIPMFALSNKTCLWRSYQGRIWSRVHSEGALSCLSPLNLGASEFVPGIIDRTTNPFSAT
jgi:GNAT superfamily N-acetyltransferase